MKKAATTTSQQNLTESGDMKKITTTSQQRDSDMLSPRERFAGRPRSAGAVRELFEKCVCLARTARDDSMLHPTEGRRHEKGHHHGPHPPSPANRGAAT